MAELESVKKLPICTECEHIATSTGSWENFKCRAPENELDRTLNLVNGDFIIRRKVELCKDARADQAMCGNSGAWFDERQFLAIDKSMSTPTKTKEKSNKISADDL